MQYRPLRHGPQDMPASAPYRRVALVLFCRRPMPGEGKRRLAHALGEELALVIAEALLACALEDAASWRGRLLISPARAEDAPWAGSLLGRPVEVVPQGEGNLGERIGAVDAAVRCGGRGRVLFIGSDAPAMRGGDLEAAAAALDDADVVLIPASDGGVTLMGSRRPWPPLADLPWSESALGAALGRRCAAAHLTVVGLPASFDIDEIADLPPALAALGDDPRPARRRLHALLSTLHLPAEGALGRGGHRTACP